VAPPTPAVSACLPDVPLVPLSDALPCLARPGLRNCASGWAPAGTPVSRPALRAWSQPAREGPLRLSDTAPPAGPRPESLSRTGATVAAGASAPSLIAQVESGRGLQGSLVLVVLRLGFGIRVKHLRLLA
jgi:hypothetical protein